MPGLDVSTSPRSQILRMFLWALVGVLVGYLFLQIQTMSLYRIVVIIGGIGFLVGILTTTNRLWVLMYFFFFSMVFIPDKYFSIVYGCSWYDGISVTSYDVIFFLLVVVFSVEYRIPWFRKQYWVPAIEAPLWGLLLASVLSLFNTFNLLVSSYQIINFAKLLVVYFFLVRIFQFLDLNRLFRKGIFLLVGVEFVIFMIEVAQRGGISDFRLEGSFANPNSFAEFFVPTLLLLFGFWFTGKQKEGRWSTGLFLILNAILVLFTFSRGGWISAFLALGVMVFFLHKYGVIDKRELGMMLLALLAFLLIFHQPILQRLHFGDESAHSRIYLNKIAWQMIKTHPLWGIGVNTFPFLMRDYYHPGLQLHTWLHTVHNQYLLVWSEMGIPGIVSFLALLLGAWRIAFRVFRKEGPYRFLGFSIGTAIFANALHMLVDMYVAMSNWLWLVTMLAALSVAYRPGNLQREETT